MRINPEVEMEEGPPKRHINWRFVGKLLIVGIILTPLAIWFFRPPLPKFKFMGPKEAWWVSGNEREYFIKIDTFEKLAAEVGLELRSVGGYKEFSNATYSLGFWPVCYKSEGCEVYIQRFKYPTHAKARFVTYSPWDRVLIMFGRDRHRRTDM